MTLVPKGFLCVLRIHYISGRPFSVVLLLTPNFFEYSTFPSTNSHFSMFFIVQVLFSSAIIPTLFKITLTLFRMGIFGAAHGWGVCKKVPFPKICHTYPTMLKLDIPKEDPKIIWIRWHTLLSSAGISIFSPGINNFCYIKKYRYKLHFGT